MNDQKDENEKEGAEGILDLLPEEEKTDETEEETSTGDEVVLSKQKIVLIKKMLGNIKESNERLFQLFSNFLTPEEEARISVGQQTDDSFKAAAEDSQIKIIEGVFDGESMVGPDGKRYNVPANYASKSKLIEGDILKLTITANGTFVYKQIGPAERTRLIGVLHHAGDNEYSVSVEGRSWRVLNASVTYFKGEEGDETVILVPKSGESKWAAVENIVRK